MYPPMTDKPPQPDETTLLDFFIPLAKHSRMIIYGTLAVAALTFLILLIIPKKYTASARLLPPQQNITLSAQVLEQLGGRALPGSALTRGMGLSGLTGGLLGLKSPGDLYVGILTGETISDRIIVRFNLRTLYDKKYIEDVRMKLAERTRISSEKDGLIVIEVTDEDPRRAAEMANSFVDELGKLLREIALQEAKDRLVFLEQERQQSNLSLTKAEEDLRNFGQKHSVLQIDSQIRGALEYIASLRAAIDAKQIQLQVMRQQAAPSNYDLVKLETEVKGLQDKLKSVENQEVIPRQGGDAMLATSKVPALGLEYQRLYREVKFQEALYGLYCRLVELARMDKTRNVDTLQIVDEAKPPEKKSSPKRLLGTFIALVLSFFSFIFLALAREYWQGAKMKPENASRLEMMKSYLESSLAPMRQLFSRFSKLKPDHKIPK